MKIKCEVYYNISQFDCHSFAAAFGLDNMRTGGMFAFHGATKGFAHGVLNYIAPMVLATRKDNLEAFLLGVIDWISCGFIDLTVIATLAIGVTMLGEGSCL